jgi:hypothetical protein
MMFKLPVLTGAVGALWLLIVHLIFQLMEGIVLKFDPVIDPVQ